MTVLATPARHPVLAVPTDLRRRRRRVAVLATVVLGGLLAVTVAAVQVPASGPGSPPSARPQTPAP